MRAVRPPREAWWVRGPTSSLAPHFQPRPATRGEAAEPEARRVRGLASRARREAAEPEPSEAWVRGPRQPPRRPPWCCEQTTLGTESGTESAGEAAALLRFDIVLSTIPRPPISRHRGLVRRTVAANPAQSLGPVFCGP